MTKKTEVEKTKILVLGAGIYARPFEKHGDCRLVQPHALPDEFSWPEVKMVVFTGGEDVDPELYGDYKHQSTVSNINRDKIEVEFFKMAFLYGVPMVGICRGSQFLTVMNGGKLVQDCGNHAIQGTHTIHAKGKVNTIDVTSTHHQMMIPEGDFNILAYANGLSSWYQKGNIKVTPKSKVEEPEVVWYPNSASLAVQYHPEYMEDDSQGYQYFQELLEDYIL